MAYTSCFIQGISWTSHIAVVMFLIVFSVYNLNRKTDEAEDALNHERRFRITKKFERHLFVAALGAYLIALIIAAFHGIAAFCVVIDTARKRNILQRSCTAEVVRIPAVKRDPCHEKPCGLHCHGHLRFHLCRYTWVRTAPDAGSMIVFLFIFCWTFVASVLPDIRDRSGDSATGVATIPVLVGVARSRSILTFINISAGAIILILGSTVIPVPARAIIVASLVYSQACIISIDRTTRNDLLCDVISDGQFLTIGGLCLVISSMPYLQF